MNELAQTPGGDGSAARAAELRVGLFGPFRITDAAGADRTPKGAKAKPLGPNGSPVKSTASTCPRPVEHPHGSLRGSTRGQTLEVDPTAANSAPG